MPQNSGLCHIQNNSRNNQQIAAQTRQTTRKSEKTKHAHMKMEINENATTTTTTKTNTSK
jgi:hypothetical protein